MIITFKADGDIETLEVESHFEAGKITYIEPDSLANVTIYFRLDEVMIQKSGSIQFQEYFVRNQITQGFYRRDSIVFKTIIETKNLLVTPEIIHIEYLHNIEGHVTTRMLEMRLFK